MAIGAFDLGGVLYDFAGRRILERHSRLPHDESWRIDEWAFLPFVRAFETGRGSVREFGEGVVRHFQLQLVPDEFVERFALAARGFYPGALELVTQSRFSKVVTLSNTNELHWPVVLRDLSAMDPFDGHFPSHMTGHHKPERQAFMHLQSQFPGEDIVFFDDREDNVQAARLAGLQGYRVEGVAGLRSVLLKDGMLGSETES